MRNLSALLVLVICLNGCIAAHVIRPGTLAKYEDPEGELQMVARSGDLEIRLADELKCWQGTHLPVMFKNNGSSPIKIDPSDYFLEAADGERIRHITHGTESVSGSAAWMNQLIKQQNLEPGASVRGRLVFSRCTTENKTRIILHIGGQSVVYDHEEKFSWMWLLIASPLLSLGITLPIIFL